MTRKFKLYFLAFTFFSTVFFHALEIQANLFLKTPKSLSNNAIDAIPLNWSMSFYGNHYRLHLGCNEKNTAILIEYLDHLPKNLPLKYAKLFSKELRQIDGVYRTIYRYGYGNIITPWNWNQVSYSIKYNPSMHLAFPLKYTQANYQKKDVRQIANYIKEKRILFYTGAGISAASGVFTMERLKQNLKIVDNNPTCQAILQALGTPKVLMQKFRSFCLSGHLSPPTKAHLALTKLARISNSQIMTENFDLLQERAGAIPWRVNASDMRNTVDPLWFKDIDCIICIGLRRDERGFLAWFRKNNPDGKIISFNLEPSDYLGDQDFFVQGCAQETVPKLLEELIGQ